VKRIGHAAGALGIFVCDSDANGRISEVKASYFGTGLGWRTGGEEPGNNN
jgi:hypothetical protein